MWFDARAKLAEIAGHPPATSATTATQAPAARPVSRLSQVSQPPEALKLALRVASVATVATPLQPEPFRATPDTFPYGTACNMGDAPRTWTGRIVSLDDWRRLTEWEKHGPNGRHWNGITKRWEQPDK
jgi:hypothetical protein